jgi:hypothetical protein
MPLLASTAISVGKLLQLGVEERDGR